MDLCLAGIHTAVVWGGDAHWLLLFCTISYCYMSMACPARLELDWSCG
jgi:hypothetical protein